MKTPAGRECPYYYEDFHRGRQHQECRLIAANPASRPWKPSLCFRCPLPEIVTLPGASHWGLEGRVRRAWLGLRQEVAVQAVCTRHLTEILPPEGGCPRCREEEAELRAG